MLALINAAWRYKNTNFALNEGIQYLYIPFTFTYK